MIVSCTPSQVRRNGKAGSSANYDRGDEASETRYQVRYCNDLIEDYPHYVVVELITLALIEVGSHVVLYSYEIDRHFHAVVRALDDTRTNNIHAAFERTRSDWIDLRKFKFQLISPKNIPNLLLPHAAYTLINPPKKECRYLSTQTEPQHRQDQSTQTIVEERQDQSTQTIDDRQDRSSKTIEITKSEQSTQTFFFDVKKNRATQTVENRLLQDRSTQTSGNWQHDQSTQTIVDHRKAQATQTITENRKTQETQTVIKEGKTQATQTVVENKRDYATQTILESKHNQATQTTGEDKTTQSTQTVAEDKHNQATQTVQDKHYQTIQPMQTVENRATQSRQTQTPEYLRHQSTQTFEVKHNQFTQTIEDRQHQSTQTHAEPAPTIEARRSKALQTAAEARLHQPTQTAAEPKPNQATQTVDEPKLHQATQTFIEDNVPALQPEADKKQSARRTGTPGKDMPSSEILKGDMSTNMNDPFPEEVIPADFKVPTEEMIADSVIVFESTGGHETPKPLDKPISDDDMGPILVLKSPPLSSVRKKARLAVLWDQNDEYYAVKVLEVRKMKNRTTFFLEYEHDSYREWTVLADREFYMLNDFTSYENYLDSQRDGCLSSENIKRIKKDEEEGRLFGRQKYEWVRNPFTRIELPADEARSSDLQTALRRSVKALHVGCRVAVWWSSEKKFYKGKINDKRTRKGVHQFHVKYDDGDKMWINFETQFFLILLKPEEGKLGEEEDLLDMKPAANEPPILYENDVIEEEEHLEGHSTSDGEALQAPEDSAMANVTVGSNVEVDVTWSRRSRIGVVKEIKPAEELFLVEFEDGYVEWFSVGQTNFSLVEPERDRVESSVQTRRGGKRKSAGRSSAGSKRRSREAVTDETEGSETPMRSGDGGRESKRMRSSKI